MTMINNRMKIHITLVLVLLLVISLFTACGKDDSVSEDDGQYKFEDGTVELDKKEVTVYYPSYIDGLLHPETRRIYQTESTTDQAKQTITALLKGPTEEGLTQIIPPESRLREIFMDAQGTAYIDFSSEFGVNLKGGTSNELMLVYSIVNTLTDNFEDIKRVRILLDGREIQTLCGHLDLTIPFKAKHDLVGADRVDEPDALQEDEITSEDSEENE